MKKLDITSEISLNSQFEDKQLFSFYKNPIENKFPHKSIGLKDVYKLIAGDDYLENTNRLRSPEGKLNKNELKASLFPYVTFCGVFSERADSKLLSPSNLFSIDLDHLGVNLIEIKRRLIADTKLRPSLIFTSPSGDGLKAVIHIDFAEITLDESQKVTYKIWDAVNTYFSKEYSDLIIPNGKGAYIDAACKNISRACFLGHDSEAYFNQENCVLLGREFIDEMADYVSSSNLPVKKGKPTKTKRVNPKTSLIQLAERHLFESDNHHPQILAFVGAAKNLSFPQQRVVNYIKDSVHIAPESKHHDATGVDELVEEVYMLYSTDSEEIIYLTALSFGYNLFRFSYSDKTQTYELAGMLWDEVKNHLQREGFAKRRLGKSYQYIKVKGCVISECLPEDMKDYMTQYIMSINDFTIRHQGMNCVFTAAAIREVYLKNSNNFFNEKWLQHLDVYDKPILKDTKEKMYFTFKNCVVIISKNEGLQSKSWSDIEDFCIWELQIIQRNYNYTPDYTKSHFYQFIKNVTGNNAFRYQTIKSAIGYLLHQYYNESEGQAVILLDESITNIRKPMGGTGKGLVVNAIKQVRAVAKVDGKHFNPQNRFCWELVNPSTQIVWIDDVKPDFDFAVLHSNLTDGWTIERKYASQFYISSKDSPKTLLTSNSVVTGEGITNIRRQFSVELSNFYSKQIVKGDEKPIEETHGCVFFSEEAWLTNEWNMFYSFMFDCALQYLITGLVAYEGVNIEENRFRQATDEDFVEWVEMQKLIINIEYNTAQLHKDFIASYYGEATVSIGQKKFTNYIKSYGSYKKWTYNRIQKNGISYFFFK